MTQSFKVEYKRMNIFHNQYFFLQYYFNNAYLKKMISYIQVQV